MWLLDDAGWDGYWLIVEVGSQSIIEEAHVAGGPEGGTGL